MIKHVKWSQSLNEDLFEARLLCFSIVSFKRCYAEYLLWFFFTICWSLKLFTSFSPFKTWLQISLCVWLQLYVCVHPLNKVVFQAIIGTFYQCHFQKMVGWVAFKVSLLFMLKFKSFKMWRPMSLFILLRLLLCLWKVIPNRKGMCWEMCSL